MFFDREGAKMLDCSHHRRILQGHVAYHGTRHWCASGYREILEPATCARSDV